MPTGGPTPTTMSTLVNANTMSLFVCYNPHCMSRHKFFSTEKAFTIHFQRSPTCLAFVCRARPTITAKLFVQKRVDETFDDTVFTSTKRPKQLRCEVVNELSNVPNESFSALPIQQRKRLYATTTTMHYLTMCMTFKCLQTIHMMTLHVQHNMISVPLLNLCFQQIKMDHFAVDNTR